MGQIWATYKRSIFIPSGEPYTSLSDVWSLGLTLTELAVGHYPIPAMDPVDFVRSFAPDLESNMAEHWKAARCGEPLPGEFIIIVQR